MAALQVLACRRWSRILGLPRRERGSKGYLISRREVNTKFPTPRSLCITTDPVDCSIALLGLAAHIQEGLAETPTPEPEVPPAVQGYEVDS